MKIGELIIDTTRLEDQVKFYRDTLGFKVLRQSDTSVSFQIGISVLTFEKKDTAVPYHFAFNIPRYQEKEALVWLKNRAPVLSFEGNEIIDFVNWKAKAIYFYDSDNNIVEFIARRKLEQDTDNAFGSDEILNISEIGIVTQNIESVFSQIDRISPIDIFYGDFEKFCALGDNEGLFIVVNALKKEWFPTGDKILASNFAIKGDYNFEYRNGEFKELL